MSETEVNEKKVVGKNVAIALGMACIILLAGLAGAFAYYVSTHNHSDSEYDALRNQVNDLTDQVNLNKSSLWVDNQTVDNLFFGIFNTSYSGYVDVQIGYAIPTTWIAVATMYYARPMRGGQFPYNSYVTASGYGPVDYDFPVMASSIWYKENPLGSDPVVGVAVTIGNITSTNVTITYYY
jgi:hypothetical protein